MERETTWAARREECKKKGIPAPKKKSGGKRNHRTTNGLQKTQYNKKGSPGKEGDHVYPKPRTQRIDRGRSLGSGVKVFPEEGVPEGRENLRRRAPP